MLRSAAEERQIKPFFQQGVRNHIQSESVKKKKPLTGSFSRRTRETSENAVVACFPLTALEAGQSATCLPPVTLRTDLSFDRELVGAEPRLM